MTLYAHSQSWLWIRVPLVDRTLMELEERLTSALEDAAPGWQVTDVVLRLHTQRDMRPLAGLLPAQRLSACPELTVNVQLYEVAAYPLRRSVQLEMRYDELHLQVVNARFSWEGR